MFITNNDKKKYNIFSMEWSTAPLDILKATLLLWMNIFQVFDVLQHLPWYKEYRERHAEVSKDGRDSDDEKDPDVAASKITRELHRMLHEKKQNTALCTPGSRGGLPEIPTVSCPEYLDVIFF